MNNSQNDIELIRKYHNGELSSAEKNQLEARALDDIFLQDALDGYETRGAKEDEITSLCKKLDQRIAPAKVITPVWGFKQWGIAASILLCIALGSIYFNQAPNDKTIALNDVQQKEDIPQVQKQKLTPLENEDSDANTLIGKADKAPEIAISETPSLQTESYTPDSDIFVEPMAAGSATNGSLTNLAEVKVIGYGVQKKQDLTGAVSKMSSESLMASRMVMSEKQLSAVKLKGKIVDENNVGLPGVSVKNLSTGEAKATDVNGEFTIDATKDDELAVAYVGFDTKNKKIDRTDDSLLIELSPTTSSISEVVVVGYGTPVRKTAQIAVPKVGWKVFKQYLEEQTSIANIGRGKVQLQFIINPNGELSDFKIIETFSEKAGVAAINIIKNYNGGWLGSTEKISHKANIIIKFK